MFSEELKILDRNTVQLMIDELQETATSTKQKLDEANKTIAEKDAKIAQLQAKLDSLIKE